MQTRKIALGSLGVVLIVVGTWLVVEAIRSNQGGGSATIVAPDPLAPNPKLESEYEKTVRTILAPFFSQQTVEGIKDQLLEVVAPAAYIPVHLELVLAFDLIEQGRTKSDQALIEDGFAKIEKLTDQYRWLK